MGLRMMNKPEPKLKNAHWLNSEIIESEGTLPDMIGLVPEFERRGFGLEQDASRKTRLNTNYDMIVRKPFADDADHVPLGVVSKGYVLISQKSVIESVTEALTLAKIDPAKVRASLALTRYGERMRLSVFLPNSYSFDPGDGHPMDMRFEVLNSVDGSTGFQALLGWYRIVCGNGLVVGVTSSDFMGKHIAGLRTSDVSEALSSGIELAKKDRECFIKWRKKAVKNDRIVEWVNKDVKKEWGFKAATRAYHIITSGQDVEIAGQYAKQQPTTIRVEPRDLVPGSPERSNNAYDVSQALAWLAKERKDLQEQLEWRAQIPDLLEPLLK
jgi:hypothetical protein